MVQRGALGLAVLVLVIACPAGADVEGEDYSEWSGGRWARLDTHRGTGPFPVRRYGAAAAALDGGEEVVLTHGYYYAGVKPTQLAPTGEQLLGPQWLNDTWVWRPGRGDAAGSWQPVPLRPGAPAPGSRCGATKCCPQGCAQETRECQGARAARRRVLGDARGAQR